MSAARKVEPLAALLAQLEALAAAVRAEAEAEAEAPRVQAVLASAEAERQAAIGPAAHSGGPAGWRSLQALTEVGELQQYLDGVRRHDRKRLCIHETMLAYRQTPPAGVAL